MIVWLALLLAGAPLPAEDVNPGIDVWETGSEKPTKAQIDLPREFFGSNSDPISDLTIELVGSPLATQPGTPSLAPGDTVIRRLDKAILPGVGSSAAIPIEIVALSLKGTKPVRVTYNNGSPEEWDVKVCLSRWPQCTGFLMLRQKCTEGGTLESFLPVRPRFIFTRRGSTPAQKVMDPAPMIEFRGKGSWVHSPEVGLGVIAVDPGAVTDGDCDGEDDAALPGTSNFAAGVAAVPCGAGLKASSMELDPLEELALLESHLATIATYTRRSFPASDRDRYNPPDIGAGSLGGSGWKIAALLSSLACLVLTVVVFKKSKHTGGAEGSALLR
ncbi:MAG: hypothetical protein HC897_16985 [Thermoanaerobaculia bacterium]|nr:hypothetical protein [Thermoanaerobaculia bacterium]